MTPLVNLDTYFDQIYCINLKARTDRLLFFEKNYKALGTSKIKIIEAVDGKQIDRGTWQHSLGALGCRLSHLNIYQDALKNNYQHILVLEDDVVIRKNFRNKLTNLLNYTQKDWDMIYFGGNHYLKPDSVDKGIIRLNNTLTTHAIAINCRCLPKLINKILSDERWIDSVIADLHPELKVYGFEKAIALQSSGYSDIEEKKINYHPGLLNNLFLKLKRLLKGG